MTTTARRKMKTTTERGLGWKHQQAVARLKRNLQPGSPCWWCILPMHKDEDKGQNWDGHVLAGDHSVPRVHGGTLADRLLHNTCNSQRQDGRWDEQRPAVRGVHPRDWTPEGVAATAASVARLAFDW